MDLDEGAARDRDPEKIAVSGALCACSGAACRARGERKRWGQRVSDRERERGSGVRARWGRPVLSAGSWVLGQLAWPAWGFLFFFFLK